MSGSVNASPLTANCSSPSPGHPGESSPLVAALFSIISAVGVVGNSCLIYIILSDRKMRSSGTNLFILNMAVSDLSVMVVGVEEIASYIIDRGWLLGPVACKLLRFFMTSCLYASVLTLTAVCVERYIAIVHAMRAHIWCRRARTVLVIGLIWVAALALGSPELVFLRQLCIRGQPRCLKLFGATRAAHMRGWLAFHYLQFSLCYLAPMSLQLALYLQVARTLFFSRRQLRVPDGPGLRLRPDSAAVAQRSAQERAMEARRQVVKMLIACVLVYFVCNSPMAVPLVYNTVSSRPFVPTAVFRVAAIMMAYANSAANPILYSVFSQRFRDKFKAVLLCRWRRRQAEAVLDAHTMALTARPAPASR